MSASRQELARLARALAASARRAEWRGQKRLEVSPKEDLEGRPEGVDSHPGQGQSAKVQVPRERKAEQPKASPTHNPPPTQGKTAAPPSELHSDREKRSVMTPQPPPARVPNPSLEGQKIDAEARSNQNKAAACGALDDLRGLVADCRACPLHATRNQTVFQDGSGSARVLFVGEAPGADEDAQGVPFVGAAGRLLTDIIEKGMGLARQDVAIANVLKCRPPGNRDPEALEKERCTPFLDRQIELIDPELIIPLGRHASQHLLKSHLSMGRLRGRVHVLGQRKVVPTYHPAYLLRNPAAKKDCWQDIQVAMGELGLTRPPGS